MWRKGGGLRRALLCACSAASSDGAAAHGAATLNGAVSAQGLFPVCPRLDPLATYLGALSSVLRFFACFFGFA